MNMPHRLGAGLLAGSLLASGVAGAMAARPNAAPHRGFAFGVVSNLSPSGFTLTRSLAKPLASGATTVTVSVTLTAATKEQPRKGVTTPLANGDYALAIGPKTGSSLTANRVLFSTQKFPAGRIVSRAIASTVAYRISGSATLSGSTLVLTTRAGKTYTFTVDAQTRFWVNGKLQTAPLTAVPANAVVRVRFAIVQSNGTTTLVARAILIHVAA